MSCIKTQFRKPADRKKQNLEKKACDSVISQSDQVFSK